MILDFSIINFEYQLPHELPKDLRFRTLENQEIFNSPQSPFEKQIFSNINQNHEKRNIKVFCNCPILLGALLLANHFCQDYRSRFSHNQAWKQSRKEKNSFLVPLVSLFISLSNQTENLLLTNNLLQMLKYQLFKLRENRSIGLTNLKTYLINIKSMEQNIGQCSSQKKQKC